LPELLVGRRSERDATKMLESDASEPDDAARNAASCDWLCSASAAVVPVDTMPSWLQGFAAHQPITPVIETLRARGNAGRHERVVTASPDAGEDVGSGI
jgi:hypothetical protein